MGRLSAVVVLLIVESTSFNFLFLLWGAVRSPVDY